MSLLSFLWRSSQNMVVFAVAASLVSGISSAGLLATINLALHSDGSQVLVLATGFAILGICKVCSNALAKVLVAQFTQRATATMRLDMSRKILAVPLARLETIGIPRLLANLISDVQTVREALRFAPGFVVNLAVAAGCTAYLGWLSWQVLLVVLACVLLGVLSYRILASRGVAAQRRARLEQDNLFGLLRDLTEGIKELKLHKPRQDAFVDDALAPAIQRMQEENISSATLFALAQSWSQLMFFLLVGIILFALPGVAEISSTTLTGYVLTIIYLLGPLAGLADVLPRFSAATIALQHIQDTGLLLGEDFSSSSPPSPSNKPGDWQQLTCSGVSFRHPRQGGDRDFKLGPLDLSMQRGEIVFLVGGNGSGKSTLARVLAGLYPPDAGQLQLDGRSSLDDPPWYSGHFSMVFADAHIFENLRGLPQQGLDASAHNYLVQLGLDHKVQVEEARFSTTNLSQGERKRLALLSAYLEDRPIYIFDEWAADQDPEFKEFYYTRWLPDLKTRGKAVLVISHDDRYFHVADRILKLEDGHLV